MLFFLFNINTHVLTIATQPPRSSHPIIKFSAVESDPFIIKNFPFDKYELEPSPLTQHLLSMKTGMALQTFIFNSNGSGTIGEPFGFLKTASSGCYSLIHHS